MEPEQFTYIISGACAFGMILLGLIYSELKGMRKDLTQNTIKSAEYEVRIFSLEKFRDTRNCANGVKCSY